MCVWFGQLENGLNACPTLLKLRHPLHASEHTIAERLKKGEVEVEKEESEPEDVFEGDLATHPYFQVRKIPLV